MFALEIDFRDGVSRAEVVLVRRPVVIVGASEQAYLVLEGVNSQISDFALVRGPGREFYVHSLGEEKDVRRLQLQDGVYTDKAELLIRSVSITIWALDVDLLNYEEKFTARTAVGILRKALQSSVSAFPAIAVIDKLPTVISIPVEQEVFLGKSRRCYVRCTGDAIANEHLRLRVSDGAEIGGAEGEVLSRGYSLRYASCDAGLSVSCQGKESRSEEFLELLPRETLTVGSNTDVFFLRDVDDLKWFRERLAKGGHSRTRDVRKYPSVIINYHQGEYVKRFAFNRNSRITVGRDPASDIWLKDSHISGQHLELVLDSDGVVVCRDVSTNGSFIDGVKLPTGIARKLAPVKTVINLQNQINLTICFQASDESEVAEHDSEELLSNPGKLFLPEFLFEGAGSDSGGTGRKESARKDSASFVATAEFARSRLKEIRQPIKVENKVENTASKLTNVDNSLDTAVDEYGEVIQASRSDDQSGGLSRYPSESVVKLRNADRHGKIKPDQAKKGQIGHGHIESGQIKRDPKADRLSAASRANAADIVKEFSLPIISWRTKLLFGVSMFCLMSVILLLIIAIFTN